MAWNVWLGNPYELHFNWRALNAELTALLTPVVKLHDNDVAKREKFGSVSVHSTVKPVTLTRHDLLVYVVPTPNFGFIGADFGDNGHLSDAGGGCSTIGNQVCTEAYVAEEGKVGGTETVVIDRLNADVRDHVVSNRRDVRTLAKLIIHEAMHNRTQSFEKMHSKPGMQVGAADISKKTSFGESDKKLLAKHLRKSKHDPLEWTGAWNKLSVRMPLAANHQTRLQSDYAQWSQRGS